MDTSFPFLEIYQTALSSTLFHEIQATRYQVTDELY